MANLYKQKYKKTILKLSLRIKTFNLIGVLSGAIRAPGSKSHSIRSLMFSMLSRGKMIIHDILESNDIKDMRGLCHVWSKKIKVIDSEVFIFKNKNKSRKLICGLNSGNSGLSTYFILPMIGLKSNSHTFILNCGLQMSHRPIVPLIKSLNQLGMSIVSVCRGVSMPVRVSGRLIGGKAIVAGDNSQYLSSLLVSLPFASCNSKLMIRSLCEKSYVDLTYRWLLNFSLKCDHNSINGIDVYSIEGNQICTARHLNIYGDYSSISCIIAAATILTGRVLVRNLSSGDHQGDRRIIEILKSMGAFIYVKNKYIVIDGGYPLNGLIIDANNIPDLLPIISVVGCYARHQTVIYNIKNVRAKETDRLQSISLGLTLMGADVKSFRDGMVIKNGQLNGTLLRGFDDHRTVMSLSIAGLIAKGLTTITTVESVQKTYPNYIKDMIVMGAKIKSY